VVKKFPSDFRVFRVFRGKSPSVILFAVIREIRGKDFSVDCDFLA